MCCMCMVTDDREPAAFARHDHVVARLPHRLLASLLFVSDQRTWRTRRRRLSRHYLSRLDVAYGYRSILHSRRLTSPTFFLLRV
jgi:hypothetical protein